MDTAAWIVQIGHACLWGSVWIAAVGLCCRLMPRLPAALRSGLWWLACLAMLLGFCAPAPINLPVLPPSAFAARPALTPAVSVSQSVKSFASAPNAAAFVDDAATPAPQTPHGLLCFFPVCLFAVWLVGVAASFCFAVRQSFLLKRLQRGTVPAPLPGIDLAALARQIGLRRAPFVLIGSDISAPCVTGWLRPVILLPPGLSETLSASEMSLTLAHEMAHVKRGDLPLAAVPLLARILFFFHPLIWWAAGEWAAAREEACDALALSGTCLSRADYGLLLLKLAGQPVSAPALGLSPGYLGLRRRLLGLSRVQPPTRSARLLLLALPLLLPWRLSAARPPAEPWSKRVSPTLYSVAALADSASGAAALNSAGQIAFSVQASGPQSYLTDTDTRTALAALPKHHNTLAFGINSRGEVAGTSFNIPGHGQAFFWDGATHKIGSLPGYPYSEARGVNDLGQVAGFSETGRADRWHAWITHAFLHQPTGTLTDLGTLGGSYSAAYAVSALGTVVGKADTAIFGATHAFAWTNSRMTDLGTLGGADSAAYAINDRGEIAGASDLDQTESRHAFLYAEGQMRDLSPLAGMTRSAAYDLNNQGQIVGVSQNGSIKCATLWQNDAPTDLNTLLPPRSGWTLTEARAVNNRGQIIGSGLFHGKPCAFLLTPLTH